MRFWKILGTQYVVFNIWVDISSDRILQKRQLRKWNFPHGNPCAGRTCAVERWHWMRSNCYQKNRRNLFIPNTFCTKQFFYTKQLLHKTVFTPGSFHSKQILHQTVVAPNCFFTKQLLHQTTSTPNSFFTKNLSTDQLLPKKCNRQRWHHTYTHMRIHNHHRKPAKHHHKTRKTPPKTTQNNTKTPPKTSRKTPPQHHSKHHHNTTQNTTHNTSHNTSKPPPPPPPPSLPQRRCVSCGRPTRT